MSDAILLLGGSSHRHVPLRAAPPGIGAVIPGRRIAGQAFRCSGYGSYPPGPVRLEETLR